MTVPLDHASSADEANSWNACILSVGYFLGALGPVTIGVLRDHTGNFHAAPWVFAAAATLKLAMAPSSSSR
jgi:CP family cyanate transporter-like MFS transporter